MRFLKWLIDPRYMIVEVLEGGPCAYDIIDQMRPVSA